MTEVEIAAMPLDTTSKLLLLTPPHRINSESTLVEKYHLHNQCFSPPPNPYKYRPISKRIEEFNEKLESCLGGDAYLLSSESQLLELLDLYYSNENPLPLCSEMLPYLHGLTSIKQRAYYHPDFDVERDFPILSLPNDELVEKFPQYKDLNLPNDAFHLMTVNTLESPSPSLINSVCMDDLLALRPTSCCMTVSDELEHTLYEPFDSVYRLVLKQRDELNNRNYDQQIKLMAPLSHFLLYNDEGNLGINHDAAKLIASLMGSNKHPIYIVDFELDPRIDAQRYMNKNLLFPFCDPANENENVNCKDRLSLMEQTLMWQLNSINCVFSGLYVGNALNYHQLMVSPEISPVEFSVLVCCHDRAKFPSRKTLEAALLAMTGQTQSSAPVTLEFPDSIARYGNSISEGELLNFLNFLRFLKVALRCKKNVFVYSYDGFAGSTLLLTSYALYTKFNQLEECLLRMFLNVKPKLCLTKEDFLFLRTIDGYIRWFKRYTTKHKDLLFDTPLETIALESSNQKIPTSMDWFQNAADINFPSHINGSHFLGSVEQASSLTILSCLNIKKVISIDERPAWYSNLDCIFQHEATEDTTSAVIKPIFTFNDGKSLIYEVPINSDATRSKIFKENTAFPNLTSFVYIYNIRDDGKDSFTQLLQQCPEEIQQKILVDPRNEERVLYHCRVGVSRSATLIIASLMKYFCINFMEAYLYVRVLRFNMIIQPNLRLFYELFMYDQHLSEQREDFLQRKQCWWTVCDQIQRLNKPYLK